MAILQKAFKKELATFGPLRGPRKSGPRPLFTVWIRGARSHERIIRIIRFIRFIKIIGLICIIRIVSTVSQNLISPGRARRPLRAPGRQGPKNYHFTKGRRKELATFGPLSGPRKSGQGSPFTAWTRGPRSHERIIRIIRIIRFIKIIGLICIIRLISIRHAHNSSM